MFVDIAKIKVKAGDGGNGAVSFPVSYTHLTVRRSSKAESSAIGE